MDEVLPYLKEVNPGWEGIEQEDLSTTFEAINSYYHSLRGQFRAMTKLQRDVREYVDDLD